MASPRAPAGIRIPLSFSERGCANIAARPRACGQIGTAGMVRAQPGCLSSNPYHRERCAAKSSLKKLENDLFDKVGDGMKLYGYEPSRKDQHYVKTTSVGRLNFHLSFIRHQTDFDVTGDVAVKI